MQTSSIITLAKKQFPDWSREMILEFLNELQFIIFSQKPTNQMRLFSTTTGKDPALSTTSGDYDYVINTTNGFTNNVWRVTLVYSTDENDPEDVILYDAKSIAAADAAKIVFKSNPGTGTFYIRSYRFPTELSAEAIQLEVPAQYHISHVFEGLCGFIEMYRSGRSERYINFEKNLLPGLLKAMSDNHTSDADTPYRGY